MQLDIVVTTYNRSRSLQRTIKSVLTTPVPDGHRVRVIVADNRSTDDTRSVVERLVQEWNGRVGHVDANQGQGKSFALNAAIEASSAELIGFIDDDEELEPNWYEVAFNALRDPSVDYIGGRCIAEWPVDPPGWILNPYLLKGLAGVLNAGTVPRRFTDAGFNAPLLGGNCVIRRSCFSKTGLYDTALGRSPTNIGGEDTEMHSRMLLAGLKGVYYPNLVIRHHIDAARMTKKYMRHWNFSEASSEGYRYRFVSEPCPQLLGLPRYIYGKGLRAPTRWLKKLFRSESSTSVFWEELEMWRFLGTLYGRYWKAF